MSSKENEKAIQKLMLGIYKMNGFCRSVEQRTIVLNTKFKLGM